MLQMVYNYNFCEVLKTQKRITPCNNYIEKVLEECKLLGTLRKGYKTLRFNEH